MRMRKGISSLLLLCVVSFSVFASTSGSTRMTARAESPVDGSLWMATADNGLIRLGRNGKSIHYSSKDGKIPSDSVKTLFFDADKVLWILYGNGILGSYSSTGGFQVDKNLPDKIVAATFSQTDALVYFALSDGLYSLKTKGSVPEKLMTLETPPLALYTTEDGTILIQTETTLERIEKGGKSLKWALQSLTDEGMPIDMGEKTAETAQTVPSTSAPIIKILLLILLIIIALAALSFAKLSGLPRCLPAKRHKNAIPLPQI